MFARARACSMRYGFLNFRTSILALFLVSFFFSSLVCDSTTSTRLFVTFCFFSSTRAFHSRSFLASSAFWFSSSFNATWYLPLASTNFAFASLAFIFISFAVYAASVKFASAGSFNNNVLSALSFDLFTRFSNNLIWEATASSNSVCARRAFNSTCILATCIRWSTLREVRPAASDNSLALAALLDIFIVALCLLQVKQCFFGTLKEYTVALCAPLCNAWSAFKASLVLWTKLRINASWLISDANSTFFTSPFNLRSAAAASASSLTRSTDLLTNSASGPFNSSSIVADALEACASSLSAFATASVAFNFICSFLASAFSFAFSFNSAFFASLSAWSASCCSCAVSIDGAIGTPSPPVPADPVSSSLSAPPVLLTPVIPVKEFASKMVRNATFASDAAEITCLSPFSFATFFTPAISAIASSLWSCAVTASISMNSAIEQLFATAIFAALAFCFLVVNNFLKFSTASCASRFSFSRSL